MPFLNFLNKPVLTPYKLGTHHQSPFLALLYILQFMICIMIKIRNSPKKLKCHSCWVDSTVHSWVFQHCNCIWKIWLTSIYTLNPLKSRIRQVFVILQAINVALFTILIHTCVAMPLKLFLLFFLCWKMMKSFEKQNFFKQQEKQHKDMIHQSKVT